MLMDNYRLWIFIGLVGLGTFLMRFSFIFGLEYMREPKYLSRVLRFVPPAILAALVTSSILVRSGELTLYWGNLRLWAGLVATLVAWKTRNMLLTIAVGLIALMGLQAVASMFS